MRDTGKPETPESSTADRSFITSSPELLQQAACVCCTQSGLLNLTEARPVHTCAHSYQQPLVIKRGGPIVNGCDEGIRTLKSSFKEVSTVYDGEASKSWRNSAGRRGGVLSNSNTTGTPIIAPSHCHDGCNEMLFGDLTGTFGRYGQMSIRCHSELIWQLY